ncbi:MAG: isocitrate lyase/phosphoenolpyruvate mutase family protein [Burkholderiaceae bacterium]
MNQADKAARLRALHETKGAFVIGNAWDAGSARVLAGLGFVALATSSGAAAGVLGRRDGTVSRDEAMANARAVAGACDLPVSGDLENGYGHEPQAVVETIRRAAEAGLVGGSIEDFSGDASQPLYPLPQAVQRIEAAVGAARALQWPFALTARCENFLRGNPDLDDTIARLQAFERAGADVLMAPGLPDLQSVQRVCTALRKPFNFMAGIRGKSFSVAELQAAGVRRISLATSLYRRAMTALADAAREVQGQGTFGYLERTMATPDFYKLLQG